MRIMKLMVFAGVILAAAHALAQTTSTTLPKPTLQASLAVLAGSGTPIQDITLEGTVDYVAGSTQESGSIVLKAEKGGYTSVTISLPSGDRKEVRSLSAAGTMGWRTDEDGIHQARWRNLLVEPYWFAPELFLSAVADQKYWSMTNVADRESQADQSQHLRVKRNAGSGLEPRLDTTRFSNADIVIDQASELPKTLAYRHYPVSDRFSPTSVWFQYGDYQNVMGHEIPFHIEKYINTTLTLDIHVQSVLLNTGLQPSAFDLR